MLIKNSSTRLTKITHSYRSSQVKS